MTLEWRRAVLMFLAMLLSAAATGYAVSQTSRIEPISNDPEPAARTSNALDSNILAPVASFASIPDERRRSIAYFTELGKVLKHPRCDNCHPDGNRPFQNDNSRPHQPPVERGADGLGLTSMRCPICHQKANVNAGGIDVPGNPDWSLAPLEMAWKGKTLAEICNQIKDPRRNGNRTLADIVKHIGTNALVGWAWAPGFGRTPAPGTQAEAGALAKAWVETGAACPN